MTSNNSLKQGSIGLFTIVFFVIAAASPLTSVIGALPVTLFIGNGAGVPGVFILAGVLLLLFSFGFVAMGKYVVNAGAFYAYIVQGIGIRSGFAGLGAALLAYTAIQLSVNAMFGVFADLFLSSHWGIHLPWWLYSIVMQIVVILLGISKVEIGGKILGFIMILEVGIVLLLNFKITDHVSTYSFSSFSPEVFLGGNFGITMVFAISSFIGFEATAIYAEECENPEKTVGRATFIAVSVITLFYAFTAWALVQYIGVDQLVAVAKGDPGVLVYNIAAKMLGPWSVELMSLLLITSLFAATQAFHNSLARYLFAMSRDGLLWSAMAKTHPVYQSPYISSIVQGIGMLALLGGAASLSLDPMVEVFAWGSALASMAILVLQVGVSLAVINFFRTHKNIKVSLWSGFIAPAISAIGMVYILVLVIKNIETLSGSHAVIVQYLPWLVLFCTASGAIMAQLIKSKNPSKTTSHISSYSETEILFAVEKFIINIQQVGFENTQKQEFKELLELFDTIYNPDYYYSDYITAFIKIKLLVDQTRFDLLLTEDDSYDFVLEFDNEQFASYEKMLNLLKGEIELNLHQSRLQEKNNKESLMEYAKQLFNHSTKLLIVRVDLGYLNDSKQQITIDQFYQHFEIMRSYLSNQDTFFSNIHGYSWTIEQGEKQGYHVHLLLMYDGTKVQNAFYYAQRVGKEWKEITKGSGRYFNLHDKEYLHQLRKAGCDIGLGTISRNNAGDWERLVAVIEYLTDPIKDEQSLRVKCLKNMQTFENGVFENSQT